MCWALGHVSSAPQFVSVNQIANTRTREWIDVNVKLDWLETDRANQDFESIPD